MPVEPILADGHMISDLVKEMNLVNNGTQPFTKEQMNQVCHYFIGALSNGDQSKI